MLKFQLNVLKKGYKMRPKSLVCFALTSSSSLRSKYLVKGCVAAVQNDKSVIWKPHQALAAVLLDKLCNNNLIFEQFRKRVRVPYL